MNKVEVSKISLKIGKKKQIDLSLKEARELQQVLTDLLGNQNDNAPVIVTPIVYPTPVYPKHYEWWEVKPIWTGGDGTITISSSATPTKLIEDSSSYVIS